MTDFAQALRSHRLTAGLTLREAAALGGVTKGYLSKIEGGTATPSIAVLSRLAGVYGVSLSDVFTDGAAASHFALVRAGERRPVNRDGTELGYVFESISFRKKDRRGEVFVLSLPALPPDAPRQLYRHRGEEIFYVLEGVVRFTYGPAEHILHPGDCVQFDPSVDHRGEAYGPDPARAFVVILPATDSPDKCGFQPPASKSGFQPPE